VTGEIARPTSSDAPPAPPAPPKILGGDLRGYHTSNAVAKIRRPAINSVGWLQIIPRLPFGSCDHGTARNANKASGKCERF